MGYAVCPQFNYMKKILIYSPSYNENMGGVIVLHKLCSLLNDLGYEAYLWAFAGPNFFNEAAYLFCNPDIAEAVELGKFSSASEHWYKFGKTENRIGDHRRICASNNTPLFCEPLDYDFDGVVLYPEIVGGNPLKAKNVVRWLLYKPGFFTGEINYGSKELYFLYDKMLDFRPKNSSISKKILRIIDYPLKYYNQIGVAQVRNGTAYLVRKGHVVPDVSEVKNWICIDGMSHRDISAIFKRVTMFVSYDLHSAYSRFAVLCDCSSVVMPMNDISEEEWQPNIQLRAGLAYGFSNIEKASATAWQVTEFIKTETSDSIESVREFVVEVNKFFGD
jgi:hypothetical protein|tara:strand:- start:83 stop:1081 length:999 start_codon:yes stop_codon:yes gene_type:complete